MYAVIETGGKQYRVSAGDKLRVEKLHAEEGANVSFDKVLMIGKDDAPVVGAPYVEGATVSAKVLENGKDDKVIVSSTAGRRTTVNSAVIASSIPSYRSKESTDRLGE